MRNHKFILVLAAVVALAASAFAQADQVLVSGKNQLKRSEVNTLIDFYEWAFEARFDESQRAKFVDSTVGEFRANPAASRKTIDDIVKTFPRLKAAEAEVQQNARETFVSEFIEMAKKDNDEASRMLVEIYESSHGAAPESRTESAQETAADVAPARTNDGPGSIAAISGKWAWARTGSMTKTTSGVYLGGNASRFTYEFDARGNAVYTGIMTTMTGSCKMEVFRTQKGKASLSGDQLVINWQPASFSRHDSCSPSKDYTKTLPAEREVATVRFRDSTGQKQLCMNSKEETCYSPSNY